MVKAAACRTNMMTEPGFGRTVNCAPIHICSTSALQVAGNHTHRRHTKDMALRMLYTRETTRERWVSVHYVPTDRKIPTSKR